MSFVPLTSVPSVNIKSSLKSKMTCSNIKSLLKTEVAKIDGLADMIKSCDPAFIKWLANAIENMVPVGNSKLPDSQKIDKMSLLIEIMEGVVGVAGEDKTKIKTIVEFLLNNGDIKSIPIKLFLKSIPTFLGACIGQK